MIKHDFSLALHALLLGRRMGTAIERHWSAEYILGAYAMERRAALLRQCGLLGLDER
jgi:hypothetical protein